MGAGPSGIFQRVGGKPGTKPPNEHPPGLRPSPGAVRRLSSGYCLDRRKDLQAAAVNSSLCWQQMPSFIVAAFARGPHPVRGLGALVPLSTHLGAGVLGRRRAAAASSGFLAACVVLDGPPVAGVRLVLVEMDIASRTGGTASRSALCPCWNNNHMASSRLIRDCGADVRCNLLPSLRASI
jgi:hypothetical protein